MERIRIYDRDYAKNNDRPSGEFSEICGDVYIINGTSKNIMRVRMTKDFKPDKLSAKYLVLQSKHNESAGCLVDNFLNKICNILNNFDKKQPIGACFMENKGFLFSYNLSKREMIQCCEFSGIEDCSPLELFCFHLELVEVSYDITVIGE